MRKVKKNIKEILNEEEIPDIIYKFMPINKFTFENLLKNQIWFSNPMNFNDPFDCKMFKLAEPTMDELKLYFSKDKSDQEVEKILKDYDKSSEENLQHCNKFVRKHIGDNYLISCFSKSKKNILMWGHYADKHKGICLGFDSLEFFSENQFIEKSVLNLFKVKYISEYFPLNFFNDKKFSKEYQNIFKNKYVDWEYEEEIRALTEADKEISNLMKFSKKSLREINFGCKVSNRDKESIIKIVQNCNYPNVTFIKAKRCKNRFGLNFQNNESQS
ncbi:MAG: DUF2971 domain-containing protein [Candidatus Cloacimonetes bacterium]|nr:DUF2971 domain-containing protein [Candidatus Cloacimonadota bacterium]MBT6993505.1 DUF2971 domain-containing protein [Candidatus Cloacimonadota bacterium]